MRVCLVSNYPEVLERLREQDPDLDFSANKVQTGGSFCNFPHVEIGGNFLDLLDEQITIPQDLISLFMTQECVEGQDVPLRRAGIYEVGETKMRVETKGSCSGPYDAETFHQYVYISGKKVSDMQNAYSALRSGAVFPKIDWEAKQTGKGIEVTQCNDEVCERVFRITEELNQMTKCFNALSEAYNTQLDLRSKAEANLDKAEANLANAGFMHALKTLSKRIPTWPGIIKKFLVDAWKDEPVRGYPGRS